jgi:hypothetical protein
VSVECCHVLNELRCCLEVAEFLAKFIAHFDRATSAGAQPEILIGGGG